MPVLHFRPVNAVCANYLVFFVETYTGKLNTTCGENIQLFSVTTDGFRIKQK